MQESARDGAVLGASRGVPMAKAFLIGFLSYVNTGDRSYKDRSGVLTWETGPSLGQYLPGFSALAGGRGLVGDPVRRARDGWVGEAVVSGCLPEEPRAVLNPRLLRQKGRLRRVLYLESVQNCGERLRLSFSFGHPHQLPS